MMRHMFDEVIWMHGCANDCDIVLGHHVTSQITGCCHNASRHGVLSSNVYILIIIITIPNA